jgi:pimeloyl-ACP methyl ester carboxylesterase
MLTLVLALVAVLLPVGAVLLWLFVSGRLFHLEAVPDEVHFALTDDGWRVAVHRYRPDPQVPRKPDPVLLCHGLGANAFNLDFDERLSMARYLRRRGFDAWVLELRGRGMSSRPRPFGGPRGADWCFDEYVAQDAPAALRAICAATGRPQVHWVGYSIGGLIGYALLSDPDGPAHAMLRSVTAMAAPFTFKRQRRYLGKPSKFFRAFNFLPTTYHRMFSAVMSIFSGMRPSKKSVLYNADNVDGHVYRRAMVHAGTDLSRSEVLQLTDWVLSDSFRTIDHRRDYRKGLEKSRVPTLGIAGSRDLLAPPESVSAAIDAVGGPDKAMRIIGKVTGADEDYGHLDLVLGARAPEEVFPVISGWLEQNSEGYVAAQPSPGEPELAQQPGAGPEPEPGPDAAVEDAAGPAVPAPAALGPGPGESALPLSASPEQG